MDRKKQCILQQINEIIKICSTYNEGKSANAKRLSRALKNKIYKYITSIINDVVNKYNNAYDSTI